MDNQLKQQLADIQIPVEIHERSKKGIRMARLERSSMKFSLKKRLATGVLAACILIPTGTFAYQTLLADELYGSFENVKKHVASFTMENYMLINAKLIQASGELEKDEFSQFKDLLQIITSSKLEYGDENGNIDYTSLSEEKYQQLFITLEEIQPYFDKLNSQPSSKELLSADQYNEYILALMTYETTMAKLGVSEAPDPSSIPQELQGDFIEAQAYLSYVNELQVND